jgi:hypothetical protein
MCIFGTIIVHILKMFAGHIINNACILYVSAINIVIINNNNNNNNNNNTLSAVPTLEQ